MTVKSFTIYREYFDLITLLDNEEQKDLLLEIAYYMFEDTEPTLNDRQMKIFNNLKRPLDKSKLKSKATSNQNQNEIKTKSKQNQNEITSDVNVNVNNNIYKYYENIYSRTLNSIEYETIKKWLETKTEDEIKKAIDETAKSNIDNIKYVEKVLYSKKKSKQVIPEWANQTIESEPNAEVDEDFQKFIKDLRENDKNG